jgi:small conductance mechanosensitive channel
MKDEITAVQTMIDKLIEFAVSYGFQVVGAIVILILGILVGSYAGKLLYDLMQRKNIDVTLSKFLANILKILVIAFAILISLGKFGITIAPFIAALGAAAFGASFALQGPLSNYMAGLIIIMTRPFTVGNTISVAGVSGIVEEVKLAATILSDEEGETITIPNKSILGEILHNSQENKIVQGLIGISYDSDPDKAIRLIKEILVSHDDVVSQKDPIIGIKGFGDSSIDIGFRYWVPTASYFSTSYAVNLQVFNAFKDNGIDIPFPQREVKILSES